jgi:ubiquinone/menaquinone biosynthesis C-methylase UbiE
LALLEVDRVVRLSLEGLSVGSVLDVGTGTGIFAEAFTRLGMRATGIDTDEAMLATAQHHVPEAVFSQAPAEAIPFEVGAFDLVFLGHVLHETDSQLDALREARRVARQRVTVLEWPYQLQAYGPPLRCRLRPQAVEQMAAEAGYGSVETIRLNPLDFYRLTP